MAPLFLYLFSLHKRLDGPLAVILSLVVFEVVLRSRGWMAAGGNGRVVEIYMKLCSMMRMNYRVKHLGLRRPDVVMECR